MDFITLAMLVRLSVCAEVNLVYRVFFFFLLNEACVCLSVHAISLTTTTINTVHMCSEVPPNIASLEDGN